MIERKLAFLLVFIITSHANATYSLVVTGANRDVITIHSDTPITSGGEWETYFALVVPVSAGELSAANAEILKINYSHEIYVYDNCSEGTEIMLLDPPQNGVGGGIFTYAVAIPAGDIITGILYTGTATNATLYKMGPDNLIKCIYDSELVGVPEPGTVLLMGLGGMLIQKRR